MVISASRRTDLPAFHSDAFLHRVREGFVDVSNPRDPAQVRRVSLLPDDVDCLVFWTKNPAPLMERLDELEAYPSYFLFTLNPYGTEVEPGVPPVDLRIATFLRLSERLGPSRVVWRYDPILLSDRRYTEAFHAESFETLAGRLEGAADACILSFLDEYARVKPALRGGGLRAPTPDEMHRIAACLSASGRRHGIRLSTCAEAADLADFGIGRARCIDPERVRRISGRSVPAEKDPSQRPSCGCAPSIDIGAYGTCRHGCVYCYARRGSTPMPAEEPMSCAPSSGA